MTEDRQPIGDQLAKDEWETVCDLPLSAVVTRDEFARFNPRLDPESIPSGDPDTGFDAVVMQHPRSRDARRFTRLAARERSQELGQRVRSRRKTLGLSQEQLGERCGLHRTYIGMVERGEVNISLRNLLALADGLGINIGDLVRVSASPEDATLRDVLDTAFP